MNFKNLIKIKRVINDAIPYVVYNNILEKFSKSDDRKFYIYFDNDQKVLEKFKLFFNFLLPQNNFNVYHFNNSFNFSDNYDNKFECNQKFLDANLYQISEIAQRKDGKNVFILCDTLSLFRKYPSSDFITNKKLFYKVNDIVSKDVAKILTEYSYKKVDTVRIFGEFAFRGEIVDISLSDKFGVRLHLFDDVIESIKLFSLKDQLSFKNVDNIRILPIAMEEYLFNEGNVCSIFDYCDDKYRNLEIFSTIENLSKMQYDYHNVCDRFQMLQKKDMLISNFFYDFHYLIKTINDLKIFELVN